MRPPVRPPARSSLRVAPSSTQRPNAGREFALTTTLLFVVVTIIRWRASPTSPLTIGSMPVLSAIAGLLEAILIAALMYSRLGRRSGGHMHAGVSVFVWLTTGHSRRRRDPVHRGAVGRLSRWRRTCPAGLGRGRRAGWVRGRDAGAWSRAGRPVPGRDDRRPWSSSRPLRHACPGRRGSALSRW